MCTRHRSIHLPWAALLSLGLLFLIGGAASAHGSIPTHATVPAHAKVYKAIPAIGSTIAQVPTTVTVFTLENINPDPRKSNLFVYGPGGDLISQGADHYLLEAPQVGLNLLLMIVPLTIILSRTIIRSAILRKCLHK